MLEVGRVGELWRYPVKSMEGSQVQQAVIDKTGLLGDRNWIIKDETTDELSTVRKIPKLLKLKAFYDREPKPGNVAPVSIELPGGELVSSADSSINAKLSEVIGKPVSLWPLQPKTNLKHYLLKVPAGSVAMKKQFATKTMPDMSSVTWRMMMELAIFATPLGRYHDVFPLHLLTTSSLEKLKQLEPEGDFRVERFRPNLLIETATNTPSFEEFDWVDGKLYVGNVVLKVVSRTVRCSMPAQPQATLVKDSKVLRTLESHTQRHLGVNISIEKSGTIRVGDRVRYEPSDRSLMYQKYQALSAKVRNQAIQSSFKLIDKFTKQN